MLFNFFYHSLFALQCILPFEIGDVLKKKSWNIKKNYAYNNI